MRTLIEIAFGALAGIGVGFLYFHAVERRMASWVGDVSSGRALARLFARLLVAGLAFWGLAHAGPLALLAATAGFLLARQIAIERASRDR